MLIYKGVISIISSVKYLIFNPIIFPFCPPKIAFPATVLRLGYTPNHWIKMYKKSTTRLESTTAAQQIINATCYVMYNIYFKFENGDKGEENKDRNPIIQFITCRISNYYHSNWKLKQRMLHWHL